MSISDWILLGTAIVALFAIFAERLWNWLDRINKRKQINIILESCFKQLIKNFKNIRENRSENININQDNQNLKISVTSFSEINGYYHLLTDLILPNIDVLHFRKYTSTIDFFIHYRINMEEINNRFKREGRAPDESYIKLGTFKKLIERAENAFNETRSE